VHGRKVYGGSGVTVALILNFSTSGSEWSTSYYDHFILGSGDPCSALNRRFVSPRADPGTLEKREVFSLLVID
jgi:hypothetical protein